MSEALSLRPGDGVVPFPGQPKPMATFEETAALDFEPVAFDLGSIPGPERMNDPYMISMRLAAVIMTKSKVELVEIARGWGAETDDGGELADLVEKLQESQAFFNHAAAVMHAAELRLLVASCFASQWPAADQ